jgi:exo-beta-1,3-glucanase (GH17 family)
MSKRLMRIMVVTGLTILCFVCVGVLYQQQKMKRESRDQRMLREKLHRTRFVAYAPTNYNPTVSPPVMPSDASIKADLVVLRNAGFTGLVTYTAEFTSLPQLAEEAGFQGILLGVWNPRDRAELEKAKQAAKRKLVIATIICNEALMDGRIEMAELRKAMEEMRRDTRKPVSTTEVIERYFSTPELIEMSDFLAVNAHPFHHNITDPVRAVEWTGKAYNNLAARTNKYLLFHEVGLPGFGAKGLSEDAQAKYYELLSKTNVRFVWFEAFDGPWKKWATTEPHWGLFHSDRTPKPVVQVIRD